MISRVYIARNRDVVRGIQQLVNHRFFRGGLSSESSGSEVDSGTSFLGSREPSGHSSSWDRKQKNGFFLQSSVSFSDLRSSDDLPYQLGTKKNLNSSTFFKGEGGWTASSRERRGGVLPGPFAQLEQRRHYIQLKTDLQAADNSGAKRLSCIKVLKGTRPNAAGLGDVIVCSVKEAMPRGKVKKGEVVTCVVVRSAMHHERSDGGQIRFDDNAAVVINKAGEPIGTRVFGPVPHELREKKFVKILTLAQQVI